MARPKQDTPTEREMDILHVLWEHGPLGTRDIVTFLNEERSGQPLAYTSVHTILSIMVKKGLVLKGSGSRSHTFNPSASKDVIEAKHIQKLKRSVFGGSTMRLVSRALSTHSGSKKDLEKIQELLESSKRNVGKLAMLNSLLNTPGVELLGRVLLHSLWQGVAIAACLALALYLLRRISPELRYHLCSVRASSVFGRTYLYIWTSQYAVKLELKGGGHEHPSYKTFS